ncbi:Prolyl 4-hydroxylase subunit alpha-1, partial [Geodia barretti]
SGWLSSEDDPLGYVDRIDRRIEDFTGLTMSTAEQLQVVNYGIGGQYEPHYDFARVDEDAFSDHGAGNRIATVLFYMSDVELGGATVFPLVGARIQPSKGDAAFWWNLKKSGEGDMLTRHAGCPVLVGTKWVCNKWIHEGGQEFRRRCGLTPNEESYGHTL